MRAMLGRIAVAVLAGSAGLAAGVPPDPAWDAAFDAVVARYDLPGLALGVIEDGEIVYVRTAGERIAGSGQAITPHTLFKIASNSKAMTTAMLARLVAAQRLDWNDPVTKRLPAFRMHDAWVTANMRVADLLVHNSGLREGAGDLMLWPEPNRFTRADIIAGVAWLVPQTSFRSGYAYDNLLYVVAGEVAAAAGGASYEDLMRREVFEPLGLECRVGEWRSDEVADVAQPHMRKDGQNVPINRDGAIVPAITSAAAGGIRCSLDAMLKWAHNWLVPDAAQLAWLPAEHRRPLWTVHTPMPISQRRREWDRTHFYGYGYGWRLADVDGQWTVSHTGTLSGMYSALTLLPDRRSGFVLLINGEGGAARTVLAETLLKHFTAPGEKHTAGEYADAIATETKAPEHQPPDTGARVAATLPDAKRLLGVWRDPWFGEASICERDGGVRFAARKSPLMAGPLMRLGERLLVHWDDERVDIDAWIGLRAGKKGSAPILAMAKVDPEGDFSSDYEDLAFTRVGDCAR